MVHCICQKSAQRLAHQQVHVFGHDHISEDGQAEAATHPFQDLDEEIIGGGGRTRAADGNK